MKIKEFFKRRDIIRDIIIIIGLMTLLSGLWMFMPWIALTIVGSLIIIGGFLKGDK